MSDTLKIFGTTYTGVTAAKFSDGNSNMLVYTRDSGGGGEATLITKSITANGTYNAEDDSADGYSSVTVTVPTGTARTSSDLTVSGDTVTVPAGLYSSQATASVAAGSAGTPTASKGTVSNHSVSVTPSVTNTTGYITGSTKTGTAVTVSASELVSGTKSLTFNQNGMGAEDVTNYETVSIEIDVPTGTARTSTDVTVSDDTVTIPAGLYSSQVTKSVASGSASTPATTISVTPGISVSSAGLITATASGSKSVTPTVSEGYVSAGTAGTITVSGSNTSQLSTQAAATITPTESLQTAVAAGKYTTGAVTVGAISSTYVGSGISQRSSTDLTASGATVTAPAGYYASAASKSVASGTAGTPTATKGTVSNHQVSVTPSVTNTTGYITGSTKTGTAVTVTASELASGNKAIVDNGTGIDVVGYSTVSVAVPFSAITVSSSNPSGGNNGDIWIKTS